MVSRPRKTLGVIVGLRKWAEPSANTDVRPAGVGTGQAWQRPVPFPTQVVGLGPRDQGVGLEDEDRVRGPSIISRISAPRVGSKGVLMFPGSVIGPTTTK